MAKEYYDKNLGIRSLKNSVRLVKQALTKVYLDVEEDIVRTDEVEDYVLGVSEKEEIMVRRQLNELE